MLIPLQVAEKLRVAQTNDFRTMLGARPDGTHYQSLTVRVKGPSLVKDVEDSIKPMGFATFSLLDATNNLRLVFAVFDLLLGIFGSLALVVASLGHHQHAGDGHSRAPPRNWRAEGAGRRG